MIKLNMLKEDSIDDILEPKSYRIPNVWEDWKFDVAQAAKRFGLTLDNLDYDSDSMTVIVTVDGYDRLGYEKYRRLYNWVVENVYPEQDSYNVEESKQLKRRSNSLIEKPVATSTKTTGYTERAIAIPKYEYSDIWEDGLEELLYDCKDVDDRVEWDIDYHGGMFGDTETLYLYSNGDTYEEIKYFIQQWRDKAMYESMKRRTTKTIKEDSFDEVGFDYKIRYISNFQQDALYDLVDYLVSIGAISGPEDKRIDIIEEPQLDSVQIKLLSDFKTYKKALDWIKHNDAYFYESKMTKRLGKKLHEQDVEIEVKNEGILEVPEGKNVEDLPMSHFEKLVKKNGLGKVNKALNNLQVWNKNKNKKLSKWAGDMIDKLNKKFEKSEGVYRISESRYDYYDPNVEANFMDHGDSYNDMPDLGDLYSANSGLPLEDFIQDALEHGFSMKDINRFLYPEKYESFRKRRATGKSSRINESFSEIEIINLIKQKYGQSGVDAFYKAEELYNEYPDTFNTQLIVLPSEPSVLNSTRMTRRSKSGKTVDACFSEIMNGNIECLPKLIKVFYDLADLPQFRKFLKYNA